MASAYVPGLKVSSALELHIERRLPLEGEIAVQVGEEVSWDTVVARTFLPGAVELVNVAARLGIEPAEVEGALLKRVGEPIKKGEALAQTKGWRGWGKRTLVSPLEGVVESYSAVSGSLIVRGPQRPVELKAYAPGKVERLLDREGVVIASRAAYVQGIFGIGGETAGELLLFTPDPRGEMAVTSLGPQHRDKILVGGALVSCEFLRRAAQLGVKGIVCGGISDTELAAFLGYDLGVAITGSEKLGLSLVITEGFGAMPMAYRTFQLLKRYAGRWVSLSGATQIRAGVIRPEVIIPLGDGEFKRSRESQVPLSGLQVGSAARLIRQPHFGALAQVVELPLEPQPIPTGAKVRVAVVELEGGGRLTLPRANLELIEA